ncbi:hypothetical protein [Thalassomonas haliotis]|uniref:Uncharacterized protein n=1 Tax=Thalassomonas haliotis TaxID=485448 RepID=A0ABY7VCL9_9GAMM|nr:hypothetical protein [Thalassomonas haliotis]WDE11036.1 hypothetical protein H3N35_22805 [Thalassomonas haliotis]
MSGAAEQQLQLGKLKTSNVLVDRESRQGSGKKQYRQKPDKRKQQEKTGIGITDNT